MSIEYDQLNTKYKRAIYHLRTVEEEAKRARDDLEKEKKNNVMMARQAVKLCIKILKDNGFGKNRDCAEEEEESWSGKDPVDLIQMAVKQYDENILSRTRTLNDILRKVHQLHETSVSYEQENTELKKQIGALEKTRDELVKKMGSSGSLEEAQKIVNHNERKKTNIEEMFNRPSFDTSDDDETEAEIVEGYGAMLYSGDVEKSLPEGPKIKNGETVGKGINQINERVAGAFVEKVISLCNDDRLMSEAAMTVLRFMGEEGLSVSKEIFNGIHDKYPEIIRSDTSFRRVLNTMDKGGAVEKKYGFKLINSENLNVCGIPNGKVVTLTTEGKHVFRYLYKKDAVISEAEQIAKQHDNINHGYSIRNIADMLRNEMTCFQDGVTTVIHMTRQSKYIYDLEIDGEKRKYIPDIVVEKNTVDKDGNRKKKRLFFEFETTDDQAPAVIAKCNKMANVTRELNFIVAAKPEKEKMIERLEKWIEDVNRQRAIGKFAFPFEGPIKVRVSTYSELKNCAKKSLSAWEWGWEKTITPSKKKGGTR